MAKKEVIEQDSQAAKLKALQSAMAKIEKDFGKGSIMKMGDQQIEDVAVIPTGSIGLDNALGIGGYPRGRIIEIYGPESSGKTTLAIHAIAEAQKMGGIAASSPSPTTANRRSTSPTNSSARRPSTSSSSTPWPPSPPRPKSKATWATTRWACKRA